MKTCCNRVHQNEVVLGFGRFFTPPKKKGIDHEFHTEVSVDSRC